MIKNTSGISDAKRAINGFLNKDVEVKVNLGRNKHADFVGTLSGIYPALFTVSPLDKNYRGKTAWSYAEILCGNVRIRPNEKSQKHSSDLA